MSEPAPIPMVDLKAQYQALRSELEPAMAEAMAATQYILGPNVQAFEQEAAAYLGVRHAFGCASGTDALLLALDGLGIGPGDEVITSPFTFIATAEAIRYVGATPVFADIDPRSFNLDPKSVSERIGARTKAIVAVHLSAGRHERTRQSGADARSAPGRGLRPIIRCHYRGRAYGGPGRCRRL